MNKLLKLALFLLIPVYGIAQSAQRLETAIRPVSTSNPAAVIIPNPKIYVCQYNAQLACNTQVPVYSNSSLSTVITQPVQGSSGGVYSYYVQAGSHLVEQVCGTYSQCTSYEVFATGSGVIVGIASASLPTTPTTNQVFFVTDSNSTTNCGPTYGGGTNPLWCYWSGSSWVVGSGAGSSAAWSSLTVPTANLSLIMGTYQTSFTHTIPYTTQSSFASALTYIAGGINLGSEWNALYSAYMPNAYPSGVLTVGLAVPNSSTVFSSHAIGAIVSCAQPSGLHYCIALYGQGRMAANNAEVSVINGNAFDNGFSGILIPGEFNSQVTNSATTGWTLYINSNIASGAAYDGIGIITSSGNYRYGINLFNGSATTAINIGTAPSSNNSMPIVFNNNSGNASQYYNASNQHVLTGSGGVLSPAFSTSSDCASIASPALCGSATAGMVAVPAGGSTLVVNTTAIHSGSQVLLTFDSSLGASLGVTCNTTINQPTVSARNTSTSFTVTMGSSVTTNPVCLNFTVINPLAVASSSYQMLDTFTGTVGTALSSHTADTGQSWVQSYQSVWAGSFQLTGSNQIQFITSGPSFAYANMTPSSANYTVSAPCTLGSTGAGWCIIGTRLNGQTSSTFNGYGCRFTQGLGVLLEVWTGGSNTQIGTTDTSVTSGTHTIALKSNGSTQTCYIDGSASAAATGTNSTYTAAGNPWIALNYGTGSGYTINSTFTVQ